MGWGRLIAFAASTVLAVATFPAHSDEIGIAPDTLTLGLHAPLTNGGIRGGSFHAGKDLYWDYGDSGGPVTVFGRRVEVIFRDDTSNPAKASQVCKEMAGASFLLVGIGAPDQMQACAMDASLNGVPYVSPGSTERLFRNNPVAFAASMSYAQQVTLVAQYIKNVLGVTDRVAAVITNTVNYDDARSAFASAFPESRIFRPEKSERGSSMAANLCSGSSRSYDVVFPLTSPAYFLEMEGSASCAPAFVGVGMTMGLDEVASLACSTGGVGGGGGGGGGLLGQIPVIGPLLFPPQPPLDNIPRFLSPAPAFENSDTYDPAFRRAAAAAGVEPDDIMWIMWGLSKTLHKMLEAAGPNPDRASFIAAVENLSAHTGVFPDVSYTAEDHFGARQAHMLKIVCEDRGDGRDGYFVTERAFVESF